MTTALFRFRHHRRRAVLVIGLVLVLLVTGAGVAAARWITAATTTTPVAAGTLTTELTGTAALTRSNISATQYGKPVPLTLRNPNPVPVNYTLTFAPAAGTLPAATVGLAVWRPTGTTCPETTPTTGVTTGTLAAPPTLQISGSAGGTSTVVCAAVRFTGSLAGSAGQSREITPTLTARMTTGTWRATATGAPFALTMASPNPVTAVQCAPWNESFLIFPIPRGVTLSWAQVPGATGYELVSSTGESLEGVTNPLPATQTSVRVGGYLPDAQWISVTALGPTGKATPTQKPVRFESTLFGGGALRCVN